MFIKVLLVLLSASYVAIAMEEGSEETANLNPRPYKRQKVSAEPESAQSSIGGGSKHEEYTRDLSILLASFGQELQKIHQGQVIEVLPSKGKGLFGRQKERAVPVSFMLQYMPTNQKLVHTPQAQVTPIILENSVPGWDQPLALIFKSPQENPLPQMPDTLPLMDILIGTNNAEEMRVLKLPPISGMRSEKEEKRDISGNAPDQHKNKSQCKARKQLLSRTPMQQINLKADHVFKFSAERPFNREIGDNLDEEQLWDALANHFYPNHIVQQYGKLLDRVKYGAYSQSRYLVRLKYFELQSGGENLKELVELLQLKKKGLSNLKRRTETLVKNFNNDLWVVNSTNKINQYIMGYICKNGMAFHLDNESGRRRSKKKGEQQEGIFKLGSSSAQNDEAFKCFQLSADQGHIPAHYELALCYLRGIGVKKDVKSAILHFKEAAQGGYAPSECAYGLYLLENGEIDEGLTSVQSSRQKEYPLAAYVLAQHYIAEEHKETKKYFLINAENLYLTDTHKLFYEELSKAFRNFKKGPQEEVKVIVTEFIYGVPFFYKGELEDNR